MIKQVANKTCDDAGDGTTTATILASAIFEEGLKSLQAGYNAIDIQRSIQKASETVISYIDKNIKQDITNDYKRLTEIATVSANWDDSIGTVVSNAIERVGIDGKIQILDSSFSGYETKVTFSDGIKFDRGFTNPYFITDEAKQAAIMKKPYILLFRGTVQSMDQIMQLLQKVRGAQTQEPGKHGIVIVADDYEPEVTASLALNVRSNRIAAVAVKAPWFAEMRLNTMDDLAIYLNTKCVNTEIEDVLQYHTLDSMSLEELGSCEQVEVTQKTITFIGGTGDKQKVFERIEDIKGLLKNPDVEEITRENAKIRISQLSGSVANIVIGANSEVEYQEKYDRFDDAIHAAKSALVEGIVPGGSYAYIKAISSPEFTQLLESPDVIIRLGATIVKDAITRPFKILLYNAGKDEMYGLYIQRIKDNAPETAMGYNAKTDKFENLLDAGVIDPFKVTRTALSNAVSVAGLMLTADAVVADRDEVQAQQVQSPPSLF